jgi:hypothetical protein
MWYRLPDGTRVQAVRISENQPIRRLDSASGETLYIICGDTFKWLAPITYRDKPAYTLAVCDLSIDDLYPEAEAQA